MYVYCISVVDNYIRQHTHQDWSAWSRCQLLTVNRYHHLIINKLNKETKYMEFTFIFRPPNPWPFCHLDFPQFETKITRETTFLSYMLHCTVMDQNLELSVQPQMREKSNKCNQCDFASSYASTLKTHLKTHSGEKTNKCNQCDYASSNASALKTHLKTHNGEKPNKCNP